MDLWLERTETATPSWLRVNQQAKLCQLEITPYLQPTVSNIVAYRLLPAVLQNRMK